ncbi:MAG: DUF2470 domain-containing protein [Actinomycetota bacterium]
MTTENDTTTDEPVTPAQHGGGESGPPIAGDPSSFPTDAELARTLCWQRSRATLSTLTADGYPYGSVVSYAPDADGSPVVLVSDMAEHTVNARRDGRASMLISAASNDGDADPLGMARCTLVGAMELVEDQAAVRDAYLERHPYAAYYVDFTDFGFWRLAVSQLRYVGGFGHMSWVTAEGYAAAEVDPVAESADAVVEHMNDDHADANLLYAQRLAGLTDATEASMTAIDRYGVTLRVETPAAPRLARVPFAEPLAAAGDARPAVIALLEQARATDV